MTLIQPKRKSRRGRIFPEYTIPPEELARREAEKEARCQLGRVIFDRVRDELIKDCYNWFMLVEPMAITLLTPMRKRQLKKLVKNIPMLG